MSCATPTGPDHVLVDRERHAYLSDAVLALPERLRAVVVGYFYEERPWPCSGTGSARPAATAPACRRDRFGDAFTGLKPRSGNGFA